MFNTSSPKVRKQIWGLLTNRWAIGCLIALTCQQVIEASSAVWLVNTMESITSGSNFVPYLILYFLSIALYYIPNGIAFILKTTWKQQAQRSFVEAFVTSNKNNVAEWNNKGIKEQKLSILTAEGPAAINALIDYVWDLCSYLMSVVFYIMALSLVVEPLFSVAYSFSLICVLLIMNINRRIQRQLTQKALTARVDLCQSLLAAWDNVLLGNEYNFSLWQEKTNTRLDRCLQRNIALERFDQFMAIFVSLITALPTLFVAGYFMFKNFHDPVRLSAFVVILPLLFNILSYTYQTLALVFRWRMHKSKLTAIYKTIQPSKDAPFTMIKKVKWPKISVIPNLIQGQTIAPPESISLPYPIQSHEELVRQASLAGRLTIRGENGCGKSTALLLIKDALAGKAFFLPTHNQLSFVAETNKYSTGESLKNRLLEILEKVEAEVLLLDEWDANLDPENKESLSVLIDELASKKCVIEVRHR
jgi:ABC-type multidrug transport system fused ATPase/permease subunit